MLRRGRPIECGNEWWGRENVRYHVYEVKLRIGLSREDRGALISPVTAQRVETFPDARSNPFMKLVENAGLER